MQKQQWHEWRSSGIGASDSPVIMGVSPFKTINQLWEEKVLGKRQPDNAAMARGRELEPIALDMVMAKLGVFLDSQECFEHPEHNWMRATIDGINKEEKIMVEIKTCRIVHEEVPEHYYPQLQHQMEVVGYDQMYYFSFDGQDGKLLFVEKDKEYIQKMIEEEKKFWDRVQNGIRNLEGNEDWASHVEELKVTRGAIKELKEKESFHMSQLILHAEGKPAQGHGAKLTRRVRKGSIDYSKIPQLQDLDLELYRKPESFYWHVDID